MKYKTSFFNQGILRNELKRFGWMGILYGLVLLFLVPLRILMYYSRQDSNGYYDIHAMERILTFNNDAQKLIMLTVPVLLAILLFRYIQTKSSVDMMHDLPIRRESLYNSYIFIGVLFLVVPVLLTALFTCIINVTLNLGDYYSLQNVWQWAGVSILMNLTLFMSAVFVGMFTGISIVQGVLTYILLLLPLGISVLVLSNLRVWMYGLELAGMFSDKMEGLSPFVKIMNLSINRNPSEQPVINIHTSEAIGYVVVCILFYFLSNYIYKKRSLEAASQTIAFPKLQPVFKYGAAFCTMLLGGIYFWETQDSVLWTLFGYSIGSLLGYFIAEAVLKKSVKVFGNKNIKGYFIYAILCVVGMVGIRLDITGYEKRIPPLETVKSTYFGDYFYKDFSDQDRLYFYDKENQKDIQAFHRKLIEDKEKIKENKREKRQISFIYRLENGKEIRRVYQISYEDYAAYLKPICETKEYKEVNYFILQLDASKIDKLTINPNEFNVRKEAVIINPDHIREAVEILKQEIYQLTYEEMISQKVPWSGIRILMKESPNKKININSYEYASGKNERSHPWKKSYIQFEKWLKEKGYIDRARTLPEDIQYAVIELRQGKDVLKPAQEKVENVKRLEIRDPAQIETCLREYEEIKYGPMKKMNEKYIIGFYAKGYDEPAYGGFDEKNLPDFARKYFESLNK